MDIPSNLTQRSCPADMPPLTCRESRLLRQPIETGGTIKIIEQRLPFPLRLQDKFQQLADSAAPARLTGNEQRLLLHFQGGISNRHREPGLHHDRQIDKIIPDITDLLIGQAEFALNRFIGLPLIRIALKYFRDMQLFRADSDLFRRSSRDDRCFESRLMRESNALPVPAEKGLNSSPDGPMQMEPSVRTPSTSKITSCIFSHMQVPLLSVPSQTTPCLSRSVRWTMPTGLRSASITGRTVTGRGLCFP